MRAGRGTRACPAPAPPRYGAACCRHRASATAGGAAAAAAAAAGGAGGGAAEVACACRHRGGRRRNARPPQRYRQGRPTAGHLLQGPAMGTRAPHMARQLLLRARPPPDHDPAAGDAGRMSRPCTKTTCVPGASMEPGSASAGARSPTAARARTCSRRTTGSSSAPATSGTLRGHGTRAPPDDGGSLTAGRRCIGTLQLGPRQYGP